jgi:hypothetical protein
LVRTEQLTYLFLSSLIPPSGTNTRVEARKQAVNSSAVRVFFSSPELLYLMCKCRRPCGLVTSANRIAD